MAALDGKITIERGLRPCIVRIPSAKRSLRKNKERIFVEEERKEQTFKAFSHCWNPVTGNAIIEFEDGTMHEVIPTWIRFVDNAMSEYAFPEMEGK